MAKLLNLRLGVADDPTALQPTLHDCLGAMVDQGELLMAGVIQGLVLATAASGSRRIAGFEQGPIKDAIHGMDGAAQTVRATYKAQLSRIVFEGGGKEQVHTEALRYEDLQLFGDAELDQSIEVARAQQEVNLAVDDVLPALDALISTLLGWRTTQPGLNPLRPDVFVRALQGTLAQHVPQASVREALIAPAAGLLGANLRRLYRELSDWLSSTGVEPAVPVGGRLHKGSGATGAAVNSTVAKTLLTLDRLRKLLAGDFDGPSPRPEFLHTMPASMAMLQELKQVDALVKRLEARPRPVPATPDAAPPAIDHAAAIPRLALQLGSEVVRLMFDSLAQDTRLLPAYQGRLKAFEPAVLRLAQHDSRFFSDRDHPARQFLDRMTQRSLAFASEADEGWPRFLKTVDAAVTWLESKVVDADVFGELLDQLQAEWTQQDQGVRQRREEGARALLQAEQRNLLAQKLAADFEQAMDGLQVADFIADFLKGTWSQVVAQAQLSCTDGSDDPFGYRALVEDLIWSVQKTTARRGRSRRMAQMVPGLVAKLHEGLERIDYPREATDRFFKDLLLVHTSALDDGQDAQAREAAEAVEAQPSMLPDDAAESPWLAGHEAQESGWVGGEALTAHELAAIGEGPAAAGAPGSLSELRTGTWVELRVEGHWMRVQLTWASPHATLFMFTSLAGTAHSMSRRTLERLRAHGALRVLAERNIVDEALDEVAKAALRNSVDGAT
jgi:hypothetical protein